MKSAAPCLLGIILCFLLSGQSSDGPLQTTWPSTVTVGSSPKLPAYVKLTSLEAPSGPLDYSHAKTLFLISQEVMAVPLCDLFPGSPLLVVRGTEFTLRLPPGVRSQK